MIIKVKDKEYPFDGYLNIYNSVQKLAEECYKQGRADAIDEYKHLLKETFNNEFPINYHCTKPFFTLDNVRVLVDAVARELKENKNEV